MKDEARRAYRLLAQLFLLVGVVFAGLALVQRVGKVRIFQGDPLGVALLVLVIGGLLWWTVRTAPPPEQDGEGPDGADRDDEPDGRGP